MTILISVFVIALFIYYLFNHQESTQNTSSGSNEPMAGNVDDGLRSSRTQNTTSIFSELTTEQRMAVLLSTLLIAQADGELNIREHKFLQQLSEMIKFTHEDLLRQIAKDPELYKNDQLAFSYICSELRSLTEKQKVWYVQNIDRLTVDIVAGSSGQELDLMMRFFNRMGITPDRYKRIVDNRDYSDELTQHVSTVLTKTSKVDGQTGNEVAQALTTQHSGLISNLNELQKTAMYFKLVDVAQADKPMNSFELAFINTFRGAFGLTVSALQDLYESKFAALTKHKRTLVFNSVIGSCTTVQKEWFLVVLDRLTTPGLREPTSAEVVQMTGLAHDVGIPAERHEQLIGLPRYEYI